MVSMRPRGISKEQAAFDLPRKLKRLRSDCPLSVRQHLATVGHRMGAVHPAYIFAGAGPCILPSQDGPSGAQKGGCGSMWFMQVVH